MMIMIMTMTIIIIIMDIFAMPIWMVIHLLIYIDLLAKHEMLKWNYIYDLLDIIINTQYCIVYVFVQHTQILQ